MKRDFLNNPFFPFALFLLFAVLLLAAKANILQAPYHWDVMGYVVPSSEAFFDSGRLSSLTGLTGHPPLFFIILAFFWKLFGQSIWVSHGLIIIFGALSLTFLFELARKLHGWKEAVVAVVLLFFNQLFFAQVGIVYLSVPLMCLAVLTVHFYLRERYVFYLISASAMLLIKETSAVVLAAVFLFDLFQRVSKKERRGAAIKKILVLLLPLLSLTLWYFYHWTQCGWTVNKALLVNKGRVMVLFLENFLRHLIYDPSAENVNRANWILLLAIIIYTVFKIVNKKSLRTESFLFLLIILNILFFSYTDDLPRYFLIVYPFFFVLGARAFVSLTERMKSRYHILVLLLLTVLSFSVTNFWGKRSTDGWRLESNMEYLDLIRVCQSAAFFIESEYPGHKILTTFPLNPAFGNPRYGYVSKPLSLISIEMFESDDDVLVVRSFQANYLSFNRFLQSQRSRLRKITEFSRRGRLVFVYEKRKGGIPPIRTAENSESD